MIYEHFGENRSFKTGLMAALGWYAYLRGMVVFCNCPVNPVTGKKDHIIRYPHIDYRPSELFYYNLYRAYVITDQGEQFMDAHRAPSQEVRNVGYFNYQAKKRGIEWHFDTVRIKNIAPRIRLNIDWGVETIRVPRNINKPLEKVRIVVTERHTGREKKFTLQKPGAFFRLYNHEVAVPPPRLISH